MMARAAGSPDGQVFLETAAATQVVRSTGGNRGN